MSELTTYDLVVLQIYCEAPGISIRNAHTVVNERIKAREIPASRAEFAKDKTSVEVSLKKLSQARLLDFQRYALHSNVRFLWSTIGRDWHTWPERIPILTDGGLNYLSMRSSS